MAVQHLDAKVLVINLGAKAPTTSFNSRTTKKSDFLEKSDLLAQPRSDVLKEVVLKGGMRISALLH
jgi:hypothetical protein